MDDKPTVLIVEDDPGLQKQLKWCFGQYRLVFAADRGQALAALKQHQPDVVTLDLGLPPDPANASEGLATLQEIVRHSPWAKVIVVTGNDDIHNAMRAVALGAYDFYQKPINSDLLALIIDRAFQLAALQKAHQKLQQALATPLAGIIAASKKMQELTRTIEKIAPTNATALLLGESGTGKEVLARAIHALSGRADQPFVAVNCAAIPEALLESELFGYEKGAFTGAAQQTKGKIEHADGGSFFLDEIGDLPLALQAKLLRFLQERAVERLGGRKPVPVNVRIICATHQDLDALIAQGRFRGDLYYRISEIVITIPPLRERDGDAVMIARALAQRYAAENDKKIKGLTDEAVAAIYSYPWPGNVREMENKIKRAVILADTPYLDVGDLELPQATEGGEGALNLRLVRERAEAQAITRALALAANNISNAAKLLGVSRPTLYSLLEKHGIQANN